MGCAPSREGIRRDETMTWGCLSASCTSGCSGAPGQALDSQAYDASNAVPIPEAGSASVTVAGQQDVSKIESSSAVKGSVKDTKADIKIEAPKVTATAGMAPHDTSGKVAASVPDVQASATMPSMTGDMAKPTVTVDVPSMKQGTEVPSRVEGSAPMIGEAAPMAGAGSVTMPSMTEDVAIVKAEPLGVSVEAQGMNLSSSATAPTAADVSAPTATAPIYTGEEKLITPFFKDFAAKKARQETERESQKEQPSGDNPNITGGVSVALPSATVEAPARVKAPVPVTRHGILGVISDVADSMTEYSGIERHDPKPPENEDEAKDSEAAASVLASIAGAMAAPLAASAPAPGCPTGNVDVKISAPVVDTGAEISLPAPTGKADANIPGYSAEVSKPIPPIGTEAGTSTLGAGVSASVPPVDVSVPSAPGASVDIKSQEVSGDVVVSGAVAPSVDLSTDVKTDVPAVPASTVPEHGKGGGGFFGFFKPKSETEVPSVDATALSSVGGKTEGLDVKVPAPSIGGNVTLPSGSVEVSGKTPPPTMRRK